MLLLFHIIVAMAGLGNSTYMLYKPSRTSLRVTQVLLVNTVASGTLLVLSTRVNILKTCITGLVYVGVVTAALFVAQKRLSHQKERIQE